MNEENNIIELSNIFKNNDDNEEDFEQDFEMIDINDSPNENENIIDLSSVINDNTIKKEKKSNDKLIERIQIGLIIFLVISAVLIYFFGYDFLEPYIKID